MRVSGFRVADVPTKKGVCTYLGILSLVSRVQVAVCSVKIRMGLSQSNPKHSGLLWLPCLFGAA